MRVERARGRAERARRIPLAQCGKILKSKTLKYAFLGVLLAVCCYFDNLGNALLCKSHYFSTKKLYKLEAVVQNDAPPLAPQGQKVGGGGAGVPPAPPGSKAYDSRIVVLQGSATVVG